MAYILPFMNKNSGEQMKKGILISSLLIFFLFSAFLQKPIFKGKKSGCSGSGCHGLQEGTVTAIPQDNLQVFVFVKGVKPGTKVAGELVDVKDNVIDFIDQTKENPFVLTTPQKGEYRVNAGFKSQGLKWDSAMVSFQSTRIQIPTPSRVRSKFELFPNHPNPFADTTLIKFALPQTARIELDIFDLNGQLIKSLTDDWYPAGVHTVQWNGRDNENLPVTPGIYLAQIKTGDKRIVRKMKLSR